MLNRARKRPKKDNSINHDLKNYFCGQSEWICWLNFCVSLLALLPLPSQGHYNYANVLSPPVILPSPSAPSLYLSYPQSWLLRPNTSTTTSLFFSFTLQLHGLIEIYTIIPYFHCRYIKRFKILSNTIRTCDLHRISKIAKVIGFLVNFQKEKL